MPKEGIEKARSIQIYLVIIKETEDTSVIIVTQSMPRPKIARCSRAQVDC